MYQKILLWIVLGVLLWSGISPTDRTTLYMEVAPVVLILPIVLFTWNRFPLSRLLCGLLTFHAVVLIIGGKYTYAEMPLFNWIRDTFELSRNYYDRFGHVVQGGVPAILGRELLLRTSPLRPGKWLFVIIVLGCLGFSAICELIEWQAAVALGSGADAFLATQGDPWDTQKDMAMAGIGAIVSLLLLSRAHDRSLVSLPGRLGS